MTSTSCEAATLSPKDSIAKGDMVVRKVRWSGKGLLRPKEYIIADTTKQEIL